MENHAAAESFSLGEHVGVVVARLATEALQDDLWPSTKAKLRQLLFDSPQGLAIDCRGLPSGSSTLVAPLLYELLLAGRQRQPRIDVTSVGLEDQTIGEGSAFLLPPRFETVEAATANIQRRNGTPGSLPVRFARGTVSQEPVFVEPPKTGFLYGGPGQLLLAMLVIAITSGVVAYSARISFATVRPPRRVSASDVDDKAALQGTVLFVEGKLPNPDSGAVLLVWPHGRTGTKVSLSSEQLLNASEPPQPQSMLIIPANSLGVYRLETKQLPLPASLYYILAISKHMVRPDLPDEDDLKTLSEQFDKPEDVLGDRQYLIRSIFLDRNVTKDMDFVISAMSAPAAISDQPAPFPPATAESADRS